MTSSTSNPQNCSNTNTYWSLFGSFIAPSGAAAMAIIPTFWAFVAKSTQQLGDSILHSMSFRGALHSGFRAAPTIGGIVGCQIGVQNVFEKLYGKFVGTRQDIQDTSSSSTLATMAASSFFVGTLSAAPLAVLNGQTLGWPMIKSLRRFSFPQAFFIGARESTFLFSLKVSDPVCEILQQKLGKTKAIRCCSDFITGATAGILGHPFDSWLTHLQKGLPITNWSHLLRGLPMRAFAVGSFTTIYKYMLAMFNSQIDRLSA